MNRKDILRKINEITIGNNVQEAIDLLCFLIENNEKGKYDDLICMMIDSFQLYGYIDEKDEQKFINFFEPPLIEYKLNSYKGKYIPHFNQGQLSLVEKMKADKKIIISAPTSFGKTSLILDYIMQEYRELNKILLVIPTNSLIEELYIKFLRINKKMDNKYNITVNTNYCIDNTIRILTPEKFLTYFETFGISDQDLIIMDETYKIENDKNAKEEVVDNRALKFRKVVEIIGGFSKKVIMLSPYTYEKEDAMKKYMEKYNVIEENRKQKYVKHYYYDVTNVSDFNKCFEGAELKSQEYKTKGQKAAKILEKLRGQQNIVYINTSNVALDIIKLSPNITEIQDIRYVKFIEHLTSTYNTENIEEWYVIQGLKKGIGVYVASMPRYVKREIVRLFRCGIINTLIVTTAFVEGVNSNARNIIITSGSTGGNVKLNAMALLNVAGRAGRFGSSFVGNVYIMDKEAYKTIDAAKEKGVKLTNPNYEHNTSEIMRTDYEIEMIDNEYLNVYEARRKSEIQTESENIGLDYNELSNICITVPTTWKIKLFNHFIANEDKIETYNKYIADVLMPENENILSGITNIFALLKEIEIPFYNRHSDVYPFKKNGEFLWGILYQYHSEGKIKKILTTKKAHILSERARLSSAFFERSWVKKYFDNNGKFMDTKLYDETFRFISNIIEYKIPYYICFFISIFKYYIDKKNITFAENVIDLDNAIETVNNAGIKEEEIPFYDYGFPKDLIDRISGVNIREINLESLENIDDYEKMMIADFISIMYEQEENKDEL